MDDCCAPPPLNLGQKSTEAERKQSGTLRRVLWAVLAINGAMFAIEVVAGLAAGSASLQADALDFLVIRSQIQCYEKDYPMKGLP